ncbi:MAG TPA: AAA family ATPase [Candidatus Magasanikbacteria bacterium]|nr:AAA family ATPase [Candidatus Magasanikbacteria bacterium]
MSKIILGFVGEISCGKSTATEYLKNKYGAVTFKFSDCLRDVATRMHIEKNRENIQLISTVLRQHFGDDLLSKVLAEDVRGADAPIIITEGVRRLSDITYLKDVPGFKLVAINTDERIRYERLRERSENVDDKNKTWEEFQKDGQRETELRIKETMEQADFTLENNGSSEDLYAQIDNLMAKLQ